MDLNAEQRQVLAHIRNTDTSCFITGGSGTGKSHLVKELVKEFTTIGIRLAVTASTGMGAAMINGKTIHSFSGIGIANEPAEEYGNRNLLISENREKIRSTDVLIIDEISMISCHVLETISEVFQIVRESAYPFGGIRMILVGDFGQLPPVPNVYDPGEYCFTSRLVKNFERHFLQDQMRTDDLQLLRCIKECASGEVSGESLKMLEDLTVAEPPPHTSILCCVRRNVDLYNAKSLDDLPGSRRTYTAIDTGPPQSLAHLCGAEKKLVVKVGAPVMCTINISEEVPNGSRGKIVSCHENEIVVDFYETSVASLINIARFTFHTTTYAGSATRTQYPLKLSFAMTIHRCQGLTFDTIHIDCDGLFGPSMLAVALSRVKQRSMLTISNLDPNEIEGVGDVVKRWWAGEDVSKKDEGENLSEDSDVNTPSANHHESQCTSSWPAETNWPTVDLTEDFSTFIMKSLQWMLASSFEESSRNEKEDKKQSFLRRVNGFISQKEFIEARKQKMRGVKAVVAVQIYNRAVDRFVKEEFGSSQVRKLPAPRTLEGASKAKARYIGGSALARLCKRFSQVQSGSAYNNIEKAETAKKQLELVKKCCETNKNIDLGGRHTEEAAREQTGHRLKTISTKFEQFWFPMWGFIDQHFYDLGKIKRNTPTEVFHAVNQSTELKSKFFEVLNAQGDHVEEIFNMLAKITISTHVLETRRKVLRSVKKVFSHRIQVTKKAQAAPSVPEKQPPEIEPMDTLCMMCESYDTDTEWICCDSCESWLHRACSGIEDWENAIEQEFLCEWCSP